MVRRPREAKRKVVWAPVSCCRLPVSAPGRLRQEDCSKFETSLVLERPYFKNENILKPNRIQAKCSTLCPRGPSCICQG